MYQVQVPAEQAFAAQENEGQFSHWVIGKLLFFKLNQRTNFWFWDVLLQLEDIVEMGKPSAAPYYAVSCLRK